MRPLGDLWPFNDIPVTVAHDLAGVFHYVERATQLDLFSVKAGHVKKAC